MNRSVVVLFGVALLLSACDEGGGPMRAESSSPARALPSDEEPLADAPADQEEQDEGDGDEPATAPEQEPDAVGLPCTVKAVFVGHCQGCHGVDAKNGTPLLTRDDLLASSRKEPSMKVVERALARATASDKPMPPVGKGMPLSEEQLTTIRDWLDQGAQAGRCDE